MREISREVAEASGERFYFTGKPCKRGHIDKRYVSSGTCVTCNDMLTKRWREQNYDLYRANVDRWQKENESKRMRKNEMRNPRKKSKLRMERESEIRGNQKVEEVHKGAEMLSSLKKKMENSVPGSWTGVKWFRKDVDDVAIFDHVSYVEWGKTFDPSPISPPPGDNWAICTRFVASDKNFPIQGEVETFYCRIGHENGWEAAMSRLSVKRKEHGMNTAPATKARYYV